MIFPCARYASNFSQHFTNTKYYFPISVHPCDKKGNGGCSQICNKRKDLHVCSCKGGFVLAKDKMTCNKGENIRV